ncbi:I78 family peptidase inhibitor [Bordetella sp. LUAb4]|uniref:I78 family peptidase inhibitor n=1 Tax=Bordetella sp. LUAb4 TaxID=2843195 RepID=UPI001E315BDB|nr:I78 family peptidase inhibitor [Bordetella sp. LUAb4]
MNWKFTAVFLLAGLTACAHNDNISSTGASTSSTSSGSAATDGGSSSSSYGGGGSGGSAYGGSGGYASPTGGYGGSAMSSGGASCDAQSVQNLIGKTLTNETTEQARTGSHSAKVRVLKPGQVMTMEYDPSRINLITDKNNALTALRCG